MKIRYQWIRRNIESGSETIAAVMWKKIRTICKDLLSTEKVENSNLLHSLEDDTQIYDYNQQCFSEEVF